MNRVRKTLLGVMGLVLVGCASTPKPEMSDVGYGNYAKTWLGVDYCNWKGWIASDTAATGKRFIEQQVQRYSFDNTRFNKEVKWLSDNEIKPSKEDCNRLAMSINERKQQITTNNQVIRESEELINSVKSQNTYCNRVSSQTFCNTF